MTPLLVDDATVRTHTTDTVYARALQIVEDEQIVQIVRRGDTLDAAVWGSDLEPYRVRIRHVGGGALEAVECTCPYAFEGWCKHAAAVLLSAIEMPLSIPERPPIDGQIASAPPDRLRAVLLGLADAHPDLTDEIEARLDGRDPDPPAWDAEGWR